MIRRWKSLGFISERWLLLKNQATKWKQNKWINQMGRATRYPRKFYQKKERGKNLTIIGSTVDLGRQAFVLAARKMVALENGLLTQHWSTSQLHHLLRLLRYRHCGFLQSHTNTFHGSSTTQNEYTSKERKKQIKNKKFLIWEATETGKERKCSAYLSPVSLPLLFVSTKQWALRTAKSPRWVLTIRTVKRMCT